MDGWIKGRRLLKSGRIRRIFLMCTTSYKRLCKNINSIEQEVVDKMIKQQNDKERDTAEIKKFAYLYTLNN